MNRQNPYIEDIVSQPEMLDAMLGRLHMDELLPVRAMLQQGDFDRVVITGMGASLYGSYPAALLMDNAGVPAIWIDNAELLHYAPGLITGRTLLWVISQSGQSAEVVHLLEPGRVARPRLLMSITNDAESVLAKGSQVVLPIDAPAEISVSTRTYLNTLALSQLAALTLLGRDIQPAVDALYRAAGSIRMYLHSLDELVQDFCRQVGLPRHMILLGRGPSMAAAWCGALVQGEAAKAPVLALNAAEFRHGPMEMLAPELTVLALAGAPETAGLNRRLMGDIAARGGRGFWVSSQADAELPTLLMPEGAGVALPLVEILPFQVLSVALAQQAGVEAGKFLFSGKVTTQE